MVNNAIVMVVVVVIGMVVLRGIVVAPVGSGLILGASKVPRFYGEIPERRDEVFTQCYPYSRAFSPWTLIGMFYIRGSCHLN